MQIQLNTGHHVDSDEHLVADVEGAIQHALGRFGDRITRVEVHLTDVNAGKGGKDTRCVIEARIGGMAPVAVEEMGNAPREAVRGAAGRLQRALDTKLGKARHR